MRQKFQELFENPHMIAPYETLIKRDYKKRVIKTRPLISIKCTYSYI